MEKLIYTNGQYNIWQLVGKENLNELAEFVVRENYKHHVGDFSSESIKNEIYSVYQEELQYIDNSTIFVVRNDAGKIIGSIRVFKWDRKKTLPLQKIFGINPLTAIHSETDYNYWHIGRFAIDSLAGIPTVILFKQLMVYAVHPIICDSKSYMIAETDSKLLKVMNALGIETVRLGHSINYLASETIPVYSSKNGLLLFYSHYENLYIAS
ncbi:hypothetical protein [Bacteroides fragilis]|uniref:hypothetical protein n=1 Tax=Bacteroides fragilis TaxID=817 RepID=UPI002811FD34|nr:hypothetical protein [Bacteroides fragilis]WMI96704.1 hypothetical protein BFGS084_04159 [Bacteroides fragilis]